MHLNRAADAIAAVVDVVILSSFVLKHNTIVFALY